MNMMGQGSIVFRAGLAAVMVSAGLSCLGGTSRAKPSAAFSVHAPAHLIPVQGQPRRSPRLSRLRRGTSSNWAGYAALANNMTDVVGSWTVPQATGSPNSYSAHWVGLDGYSDGTVEQLGTEADIDSSGNAQYYAWFEMYPHPGYYITLPNDGYLQPGNQVMAEVKYGTGSRFQLQIWNLTQRWYFRTVQNLTAKRTSAEWIVEAPATWSGTVLPLADFSAAGLFNFTNCGAAVNYSGLRPIGSYQYDPLTMVGNNGPKAVPSALTAGSNFTVQWQSAE